MIINELTSAVQQIGAAVVGAGFLLGFCAILALAWARGAFAASNAHQGMSNAEKAFAREHGHLSRYSRRK